MEANEDSFEFKEVLEAGVDKVELEALSIEGVCLTRLRCCL